MCGPILELEGKSDLRLRSIQLSCILGFFAIMPLNSNASVCRNGHTVCEAIKTFPNRASDYCSICGESAITSCSSCGRLIDGYAFVHMEHISPEQHRNGMKWVPPKNCVGCGIPFPWTQSAIDCVSEILDELVDLGHIHRQRLKSSILDLVAETPKTQLALMRLKNLLTQLTPEQGMPLRDAVLLVAHESVIARLR